MPDTKLFFKISLAQWSLNQSLFSGKIDNLDFPIVAKRDYGIDTVEYVNQFFKDKANDTEYLHKLLIRCNDNGVKNLMIMVDDEGVLGEPDDAKRKQAVENHYKWVDAAKYLGCSMVRINAFGDGTREQVLNAAVDGLCHLGEYAAKVEMNIVVENHGSYTSDGTWLLALMNSVNMKNVGTLPDFGNFCLRREGSDPRMGSKCIEWYDRYKGVSEMMPFAKSISAKSMNFDEEGNCVETDYRKMLKIIKDSGWNGGYFGIEYGGSKISEEDGIRKTKTLLEKVGYELNESDHPTLLSHQ